MLLDEFIPLVGCRNGTTAERLADNLKYAQLAYYEVVQKLRLFPSIHPIVFTKACTIGGFDNLVTINTSNSVIAFKQVKDLCNCNLGIPDSEAYTIDTTPVTQDILTMETDFLGMDEDDFDALNDDWDSTPTVFNIGKVYCSTNIATDTCMFIGAYAYPYFVNSVTGTPYDTYHSYDFETDYAIFQHYNVVDTLAPLVLIKAKALKAVDDGDTNLALLLDKAYLDIINNYNQNLTMNKVDAYQPIGIMEVMEVSDA